MPDLSTTEALLRLLIAAGLGGAIGLERELRDHEAGFRTHLIVSLGACVFTLVSAYAWTDWTFSGAYIYRQPVKAPVPLIYEGTAANSGALLAARWIVGREGVFEFSDVIDEILK